MSDETPETTTDDEHAMEEPSKPLWKKYEEDVATHAASIDPDATVTKNVMLPGKISGTQRQIDALVKGMVGGEEIVIAIECKKYAKKIGIGKVDEFAGKLEDIGVDRGILYSFNGVTDPALTRARGASQPVISLGNLDVSSLRLPDWQTVVPEVKFPKFGDCPNPSCMTGEVVWSNWKQPSGEIIEGGLCPVCDVDVVRCPTCDERTTFVFSAQDCDGCSRSFELSRDRDGVVVGMAAIAAD